MATSAVSPQSDDNAMPVHEDVATELARALSAARREIHWLRQERRLLLASDEPAADPQPGDGDPEPDELLVGQVARDAVPAAARRLAMGDTAARSTTWDRLTDDMREIYLARAAAAVEAVVPVFAEALEAIPGLAQIRLAQHRLGLPAYSSLAELLDHARAEGSAQVLSDMTVDLEARTTEHETLRRAIEAVELVIADGEQMVATQSSAVAVEVASWFVDRLRRAVAASDATLSDALAAEREQVLLAVAEQLGHTGIAALTWYTEMANRLDAASATRER